jgi:hypothetical protein
LQNSVSRWVFEQFDSGIVIAMLAHISQWMFAIPLSLQPLFRLRAMGKSDEIMPRASRARKGGEPA